MRPFRRMKTYFRARSPIGAPILKELCRASELRDILIKAIEERR